MDAFRACAATSPCYASKTKADSKGKRRPRPQPRQPGSIAEAATSSTDVPVYSEEGLVLDDVALEAFCEEGAESPTDVDPLQPRWVVLPKQ